MGKNLSFPEWNLPYGRIRRKTGSPAYFQEWTAGQRIKTYLKSKKTSLLLEADELSGMPKIMAALAVRWKNLYRLSQASRVELLATPAVGPRSLAKLEKYLTDRGVPIAWGEK